MPSTSSARPPFMMQDSSRACRNPTFYRFLLVASRWLIFIPMVLTVILLSAGTFLFFGFSRPVLTLGLKSLAMVSYDGIVPINKTGVPAHLADGPDFLFTMHKFPNAFGWECPSCPAVLYSPSGYVELAGVSQLGPYAGADPMALMLQIGDAMSGRPGAVSGCYENSNLPGAPDERKCPPSPFFDAWRATRLTPPAQTALPLVIYASAILVAAMALANEVLISRAPRHMRCRCVLGRRWCPYPAGKAEEVEALPEHAWDRVRLFVWPLVQAYFLLAAAHDTLFPRFLLAYLRLVDRRLPEGLSMKPRQNGLYLWLLWGSVAMSALAVACGVVRFQLSKPRGYISLDDLAALEPEPEPVDVLEDVAVSSASDTVADESDDDSNALESRNLLPTPYPINKGARVGLEIGNNGRDHPGKER